MPNKVFDDGEFQSELANFLTLSDAVDLDVLLPSPAHPQYISMVFNGILKNVTRVTKDTVLPTNAIRDIPTSDLPCITKRLRGYVGWSWTEVAEWHRSPLWLLIRVAIQMSVNQSLGRASYKRFILFFICTLAKDESNATLSSNLLELMLSKILGRLSKLYSFAPNWLSEMALEACTCLREMLDATGKWKQANARLSPFRNPSRDELVRDTQLSLLNSRDYIRNALASFGHCKSVRTPFHPSRHLRGTIDDFLSSDGSFFDQAYDADPDITLYDVERSVEHGIDDWLACVTNVDEAYAQLEMLMDRYTAKAFRMGLDNPENKSNKLLTVLGLYVALDKLVVKEIPMLADYSPEIPIAFLERLSLHKTKSIHRLSYAYQYLSARHSQSHFGWSVLSDRFTEDSFPVRYYDQSPQLQHLKARIEEDAMKNIAGGTGVQLEGTNFAHTNYEYEEDQQRLFRKRQAEYAQSPLPASPLLAKAVVFELQCPACVRIWRSAAPRILRGFSGYISDSLDAQKEDHLLARVPAFHPYFVGRQGSPLHFQIHPAYRPDFLHYVSPDSDGHILAVDPFDPLSSVSGLRVYRNGHLDTTCGLGYWDDMCPSYDELQQYVEHTSHTSNDVLSAQAGCPANLSINEFITCAHLRSGGLLQWLNILQGLRCRTLNLRHHQVHFLVAHTAFQIGPLDLVTGTWTWHRELQESSFCSALIDELDSLFVDVGTRSVDGVLMNTISLLLTRVLASSPNEGVSERAIALLRSVRRKTFSWVQDLSYDLAQAPTSDERKNCLLDMAATCRSTFDVDSAILPKLFHSAEDVDVLLSCAFFIRAYHSKGASNSSMSITSANVQLPY